MATFAQIGLKDNPTFATELSEEEEVTVAYLPLPAGSYLIQSRVAIRPVSVGGRVELLRQLSTEAHPPGDNEARRLDCRGRGDV